MFYFVNSPRWIVPVHKDEADQSFSPVQQRVAFSHSYTWRDGGAETWGNLFPFPSDHLYSWNGIHAQHPFPFPPQRGCSSSCICVVPQLFPSCYSCWLKKACYFSNISPLLGFSLEVWIDCWHRLFCCCCFFFYHCCDQNILSSKSTKGRKILLARDSLRVPQCMWNSV